MARVFLAVILFLWGFPSAAAAPAHSENIAPELRVYANSHPPYSYLDAAGQPAGIATDRVRHFLDQTGLRYEIQLVAWTRVMTQAARENDVLIFSLNRTAEREKDFHWILPLETKRPAVLVRSGLQPRPTMEALGNGSLRAVCNYGSSQCALLRGAGVPEAALMQVPALPVLGQAILLHAGRADIMMADQEALRWHVANGALPAGVVSAIGHAGPVITDYLAASHLLKPSLLSVLRATVDDRHPAAADQGGPAATIPQTKTDCPVSQTVGCISEISYPIN